MKENKRDQVAVVTNTGSILGVLSLDHLLKQLISISISSSTKVESLVSSQFKRVTEGDSLGKLTHILQGSPFALVVKTGLNAQGTVPEKLVGIASQMDLVTHIM